MLSVGTVQASIHMKACINVYIHVQFIQTGATESEKQYVLVCVGPHHLFVFVPVVIVWLMLTTTQSVLLPLYITLNVY